MKLWGGRFSKETDVLFDEFTASISFDQILAPWDILGSIAHAQALGKAEIITSAEVQNLVGGLKRLASKIKSGTVSFSMQDEDIHMNIERLLHKEVGEVAYKLHTGRSRNDQVALDLHLYLRDQLLRLIKKLLILQATLTQLAGDHIQTILPGYTHLQRAQPVRLAHHLLAYVTMLNRDIERLQACWQRVNVMPLGAGALAGAGFAIDRNYLAKLLAFDDIYTNSMDAVSDRDFVIEFMFGAAMVMMHLSRLSEELILWSSQEFCFVTFDDAYSSGSSMMPQKKNPDAAELIRGKTGRVYGALIAMLTTLKALPLSYNKDLQEDKEGLFDTVKTVLNCVSLYSPVLKTLKINREKMQAAADDDAAKATELADYLVRKGLPFRKAHAVVGKLIAYSLAQCKPLSKLSLSQYQQFSELFEPDLYSCLTLESVVDARNVIGGTARDKVVEQFNTLKHKWDQAKDWVDKKSAQIIIL